MRAVMSLARSCLLLALALGPAVTTRSYSGYQVLRTAPLDASSLHKLPSLLHRPEFDFWSSPRVGSPVEIMASPEHVSLLRSALAGLGLQPTVLVPDVGVLVKKERAEIERKRQGDIRAGRAPNFDNFMQFDEVMRFLEGVVAAFPDIASFDDIGYSYEGRPLRVLKLSNGPGKTGIWFDSVMHAREWAGPPTVLFAINELTENLAANQAMLDKNDFYFLPVANPDGYSYTWTDERFWRKTRKPNVGSSCVGTDPNRNFNYHWGESRDTDTCSQFYRGSSPFSEPEVLAMATFLEFTTSITFYVAVHSYGQFLLYPYGNNLELPPTNDELISVATHATEALRAVYGTNYTIGTFGNALYLATGTSQDWAYSRNIPLSYTLELPGGGAWGFDLPPPRVRATATETWEAIKVFAENIPDKRASPLA